MFRYLLTNRQGRFLLIGTVFLIAGFLLMVTGSPLSPYIFYLAIFFLGFYAAKAAVVDTVQNKELNVDLLMILSALGASLIQFESEGAMLLFIFAAAEALEEFAMGKSTKAIEELMAQVPTTAQLLQANGDVIEVSTDQLVVGDQVVVARGAQLPIDGYVDRQVLVNEAALTGESVPAEKATNEEAFAGTINEGNAFHLTVSKLSSETIFSNIIRMVDEAQNRPSQISKFIDRFESKYVLTVLLAVPVFIAILYYQNYTFAEAFYRGMILLTVSSPCALVASATPATLSAISHGAKNGVLFKGGAAMEELSRMDVLFSDKTGTLTHGDFEVVAHEADEAVIQEVVYMEQFSSHPIAQAIINAFPNIQLDQVNRDENVEEVSGKGLRKGDLLVGKPAAFANFTDPFNMRQKIQPGYTSVFVGRQSEIIGYFNLADQVRAESKQAIEAFKTSGVDVVLLTGDNYEVAAKVAREVGIEHFHADLSPEDKIKFVQESQAKGLSVGMIGDGINDAPALANAEIGIAMGSGSSIAMESSEVVIVQNDLNKLYDSYDLSHRLNRIILQNVIFSVGVIVALIALNIIGWLDLPLGVVFHEGSTILVILNGLRLLKRKD
ncbi:heavy metal translocating P-type ATPase [Fundicoccus sp. Sow4_D5]|uniref:heavy metal translocating P-type ATPase n=1 Tax=Fundicoccus sp. Sow4_D5 TaxID=3438782 RepID=UPI003F8E5030